MDILRSLELWRYWFYRARVANKLKYRDSKLGVVWPVLSLMVVTVVIGFIWGILLEKSNHIEYFLYLLCGYSSWTIISGSVEQGCRDSNVKTSGGIPFFTIVLERTVMVFSPFANVIPVILIASIVYNKFDIYYLLLFPLNFGLAIFWVIGVISFLISIVSLLPDLRHLIGALMRLAFLATPIIWEVSRLGEYQKYIWLNPFYIPLESLRSSLLGLSNYSLELLLYFFLMTFSVFVIGILALKLRMKSLSI